MLLYLHLLVTFSACCKSLVLSKKNQTLCQNLHCICMMMQNNRYKTRKHNNIQILTTLSLNFSSAKNILVLDLLPSEPSQKSTHVIKCCVKTFEFHFIWFYIFSFVSRPCLKQVKCSGDKRIYFTPLVEFFFFYEK